ncbi:HAD family hydrolase [Streptacidiphilus sp. N1-12]|uniref:HAD family hydrolase n=2 Tax=Streptacidiphilus alkalitolerans TaxID=3342712 RepID=A0ABV6VB66_9ACTN
MLLDFDGPLCSIFAGLTAQEVAHDLVVGLATGARIPEGWVTASDPLALLRRIGDERPELAGAADLTLTRLEEQAASLARPTVGGESVLRACMDSGRSVGIVSNNAGSAIHMYLDAHGLSKYVSGVYGRILGEPSSMKPDPRLLTDAMGAVAAKPSDCIFIGDAVRDVQAGDAVKVRTIGYANKPGKDATLKQAGAVVVVDSMQMIADVLALV